MKPIYLLIIIMFVIPVNSNCIVPPIMTSELVQDSSYFKTSDDNSLFVFESDISLRRDQEVYHPVNFQIQLPIGLKHWEVLNSSSFGFYYKANQVIFVKTNPFISNRLEETVRTASINEINAFIIEECETSNKAKWNIRDISLRPSRKSLIIRKGNTQILLYNIKKRNFEEFKKLSATFMTL